MLVYAIDHCCLVSTKGDYERGGDFLPALTRCVPGGATPLYVEQIVPVW
jgi:hypothetical protein